MDNRNTEQRTLADVARSLQVITDSKPSMAEKLIAETLVEIRDALQEIVRELKRQNPS